MAGTSVRRMRTGMVALIVTALLVPAGVVFAAEQTISIARLTPGQVVARGSVNPVGGCSWDGKVQVQSEQGEWADIQIDAACVARLSAKWTGALTDGPSESTSPVLKVIGDVMDSGNGAVVDSVTTCKTGKEWVYTYGGGGPLIDKLTMIWSALKYCYNDSFVWGSSTAGSACAGSPEPTWNWVVDNCQFSDQYLSTNSTSVWSTIKGTFHCDPVNVLPCSLLGGYHHHLYGKVKGFQTGHSTCTTWWDGSWVFGPNRDVISGCT